MTYNNKEIMKIVKQILGDNATGVYINDQVVKRDLGNDDMPLVSQLGTTPFIIQDTDDFKIESGLTRLCIIPKNKKIDWVIKIPITGVYKEEFYNEDEGLYYEWDNENFKGLTQAGASEYDSCDEERSIYENASLDAKKFMADNIYIGLYNGIAIYIQEKTYICNSGMGWYKSRFGHDDKFLCHEVEYLFDVGADIESEIFLYNVILLIGFQKAIQIFEEFGNFDDLHEQNYGFNSQGIPVLFDYAGYQWGNHYSLIA